MEKVERRREMNIEPIISSRFIPLNFKIFKQNYFMYILTELKNIEF